MERDLTKGNALKLLIALSIPQILSAILQQFYNTVDALIVGNYLGESALAGVGLSQPIFFFISSVMIGLSAGVSVLVGQFFGAKNHKEMKETISTAVLSLILITLVLSFLGYTFVENILKLINTPPEAFNHARDYMKIILGGTIFTLMYNLYSGILRAVGDAKSPLLFLAIAAGLNIVLDLLLVVQFNMGTGGAALATIISQGVSSLFCLIYISIKVPLVALKLDEYKFNFEKFKLILKFGLPAAMQMSVISVGNMAIQNLLNSYGVASVAGYTAAIRIDSFVVMPYMNVGVALSNFTGQNMGAGEFERVREGLKSAYKLLGAISIALLPFVWIFARNLVGIFLDGQTGESINVGVRMLRDLTPFYIFLGFLNNTSGLLRGTGDNMFALYGSVTSIVVRIIAAYSLNSFLGIRSVWIGAAIGWLVGFTFMYLRFHSGKWKEKGVYKFSNDPECLEDGTCEDVI